MEIKRGSVRHVVRANPVLTPSADTSERQDSSLSGIQAHSHVSVNLVECRTLIVDHLDSRPANALVCGSTDGRSFYAGGRAAPIPIGFPRQGRPLAVAPRPSQARPGLLT